MATFRQATLHCGEQRLTAWLDKPVKIGNLVTLKNSDDPERLWEVVTLSEPMDASNIHRDWKVGGM